GCASCARLSLLVVPSPSESGAVVVPVVHLGRRTRRLDGEDRRTADTVGDRIPKELHHRLKLYGVTHDTSVMDFVTEAVEEKLGRKARPKTGPASRRPLAAQPAAAHPNTAFKELRSCASPGHAAVSSNATPRSHASRSIAFQASLLGCPARTGCRGRHPAP